MRATTRLVQMSSYFVILSGLRLDPARNASGTQSTADTLYDYSNLCSSSSSHSGALYGGERTASHHVSNRCLDARGHRTYE